jgi:hypothetical protein
MQSEVEGHNPLKVVLAECMLEGPHRSVEVPHRVVEEVLHIAVEEEEELRNAAKVVGHNLVVAVVHIVVEVERRIAALEEELHMVDRRFVVVEGLRRVEWVQVNHMVAEDNHLVEEDIDPVVGMDFDLEEGKQARHRSSVEGHRSPDTVVGKTFCGVASEVRCQSWRGRRKRRKLSQR